MTTDPRRGDVAVVARADIARLTLRLRAAQREAAEAEAEAAANADPTAVAALEARLAPLVEQRRDALTVELERVRDEALEAIADARRQAADVLARFAPPAPPAPPAPVPPVVAASPAAAIAAFESAVEPVVESPATSITPAEGVPVIAVAPAAAVIAPDPTFDSVWAPSRPVPPVEAVRAEVPPAEVPPAAVPPTAVPAPAPTVMIDAEAFARVFANMIAQVIDERDRRPHDTPSTHVPMQPLVYPQYVQAPAAQPQVAQPQVVQPQVVQPQVVQPQMMPVQPAKQGFWATARHLDVMLLGTTMVIALVILAAWLA